MTAQPLLTSFSLGNLELKNRVIMAPLTRSRAGEGNVPIEMHVEYYRQRASAGLIISEATQITPMGRGYPNTPGIHNPEQIEAWKKVTDAVHAEGGRMFLQLWHVGRISHSNYHGGKLPVAPSAIAAEGKLFAFSGMMDFETPRALESEEIPQVVEQYRQAAANAKAAGFDGVEIHGANGYLIDQFIHDNSNLRTDRYGGSIENRSRFLFEIIDAIKTVWPANRIGLRLSPSVTFNSMADSNRPGTFGYILNKLQHENLAYLHLMRLWNTKESQGLFQGDVEAYFGFKYTGNLMLNAGFTREEGNQYITEGKADMISYGVPFIANPDLPERFARNSPLNEADRNTFYGGNEKGYTDYPRLER